MDIRTQRLNEAFRASGLSQTELCSRSGINKGALSCYLSGQYFPKQKAIEALADALNVSINYLMGYDEMDENNELDAMLLEKIKKLSSANRIVLDGIVDALLEGERNGNKISVKD